MKEINYMLYISFIIQNTREEKGSRESYFDNRKITEKCKT
jgi:hypothetical protein